MTTQELEQRRAAWRQVFDPKNPFAHQVLGEILDQAGYFSLNEETADPKLIALCNWMLYNIGAVHPASISTFVSALMESANDEDIAKARRESDV